MKPSKGGLVPHDPEWAHKFAKEAPILKGVFLDNLISLHHIGSTAIPGIQAKPTIDILAAVKILEGVDNIVEHLEALGFYGYGELGIKGRRYFSRKDNSVHLHVYQEGDPQIARHIIFCEYLISHPEKAKEYEGFKQECATKYPENSIKYAEAKNSFIARLDEEAALWKESFCE